MSRSHLIEPANRQGDYDRNMDPEVLIADFYTAAKRWPIAVHEIEGDRVAWWRARYEQSASGPWWRDNVTRRKPAIGMGVTKCYPNDRYPFSIVRVISNNRIVVRPDIFVRTDDNGPYSESQSYRYAENPEWAHDFTLTYRKTTKHEGWFEAGQLTHRGCQFLIGVREAYFSPSV